MVAGMILRIALYVNVFRLCGIVAASFAEEVIMSDYLPNLVQNLEHNISLNGVTASAKVVYVLLLQFWPMFFD